MKISIVEIIEIIIAGVLSFMLGAELGKVLALSQQQPPRVFSCSHELMYEEYLDEDGQTIHRDTQVPALNECEE